MNQTADCSIPMMSSLPEDSSSLETMSPYISPVSATTSREEAHSIVGLGISNCGLDRTFDPVTTYPYPISYTPSANTFPANQLLTPSNFYDAPSKLQNLPSDPTCFSVYNGFSDDSLSPLSPYGSHPMSASPSYNSNLELQCSQDSYQRMPGYWDSKPSSGPPMPMETRAVTGDRIPVFQHLPGQGQYCAPLNPAYPSANGGLSDHAPHLKENDKNATNLQASFTHGEPYTPPNTSIDMGTRSPSSKPPQRPRTASAGERIAAGKGFSCPVCGFTFTRKSNCKEHEKRHDPNFKRYFKCSECSKSFARNADLKRHVDNIHLRISKNPCEWCGERFSRAEALERHLGECHKCPNDMASYSLSYVFKEGENCQVPTQLQKHSTKRRRTSPRC